MDRQDLSSEIPSESVDSPLRVERHEHVSVELETPQVKGRIMVTPGRWLAPSIAFLMLCAAAGITAEATVRSIRDAGAPGWIQSLAGVVVAISTLGFGHVFVTRFRKGQP